MLTLIRSKLMKPERWLWMEEKNLEIHMCPTVKFFGKKVVECQK